MSAKARVYEAKATHNGGIVQSVLFGAIPATGFEATGIKSHAASIQHGSQCQRPSCRGVINILQFPLPGVLNLFEQRHSDRHLWAVHSIDIFHEHPAIDQQAIQLVISTASPPLHFAGL